MSTQATSRDGAPESARPPGELDDPGTSGTAILFPGQGSQTPEMRELVARVRPDLLELAIEAVGEDPLMGWSSWPPTMGRGCATLTQRCETSTADATASVWVCPAHAG
jgi:hypothetical protein